MSYRRDRKLLRSPHLLWFGEFLPSLRQTGSSRCFQFSGHVFELIGEDMLHHVFWCTEPLHVAKPMITVRVCNAQSAEKQFEAFCRYSKSAHVRVPSFESSALLQVLRKLSLILAPSYLSAADGSNPGPEQFPTFTAVSENAS